MPPTLLSPRQLAERLDANYQDVLTWTRDGLIPHIKASGRYYYSFEKVVRALHNRSVEQPQEVQAAAC